VDGHFILDLSLPPPPPSPTISSDEDRKNLTLNTTSGPITAEIWTRHDGSTKSKRVSLDLSSGNGNVRAIVVRLLLSILASFPGFKGCLHDSTTLPAPTERVTVHAHSSTWRYVQITETSFSRFPVAFAGQ
jgi:hypothetical protein